MKITTGPLVLALSLASSGKVWAQGADALPPQIVHEPCEEYKKGEPFEIWARFYDDSPIFDPKVIYRVGNGSWKNQQFVKAPGTNDFKAVIKAKELRGPLIYFIEAFDENGNGPARYGSQEAPLKVLPSASPQACEQITEIEAPPVVTSGSGSESTPPPTVIVVPPASDPVGLGLTAEPPPPAKGTCDQDDRPIYCEPVFWGSIGVVVLAGAGVGAYLLFFDNGGEVADAKRDRMNLSIGAPNPVGAAFRSWR